MTPVEGLVAARRALTLTSVVAIPCDRGRPDMAREKYDGIQEPRASQRSGCLTIHSQSIHGPRTISGSHILPFASPCPGARKAETAAGLLDMCVARVETTAKAQPEEMHKEVG